MPFDIGRPGSNSICFFIQTGRPGSALAKVGRTPFPVTEYRLPYTDWPAHLHRHTAHHDQNY